MTPELRAALLEILSLPDDANEGRIVGEIARLAARAREVDGLAEAIAAARALAPRQGVRA